MSLFFIVNDFISTIFQKWLVYITQYFYKPLGKNRLQSQPRIKSYLYPNLHVSAIIARTQISNDFLLFYKNRPHYTLKQWRPNDFHTTPLCVLIPFEAWRLCVCYTSTIPLTIEWKQQWSYIRPLRNPEGGQMYIGNKFFSVLANETA